MGSRKSTTCISKTTGTPLSEYDSQQHAEDAARTSFLIRNLDLVPYTCHRCRLWHLAPRERQTPCVPCSHCVGTDGKPKMTYETEEGACRRADILQRERNITLKVYCCPLSFGWHLTKANW